MAKPINPEVAAYMEAHGVSYYTAYDRVHRVRKFDLQRMSELAAKLDAIDEIEWARLAAFIDAEGTIRIARKTQKHYNVAIQIANTDPRLMLWLKTLFGGTVSEAKPPNSRCKVPFYWTTNSRHAEFLLRRMRPYLLLKAQHADLALAFRDTIKFGRNQTEAITNEEANQRKELFEKFRVLNRRGVPDGG